MNVVCRPLRHSRSDSCAVACIRRSGSERGLEYLTHIIYKENDRILSDFEPADAESFAFNVLVRSENRKIEPQGARLEFYSSRERANVVELSKKALNAVRATSIWSAGDLDREDEVFDLRHYFSMPLSLNVDRLVYSLTVAAPGASGVEKTLEIPLLRYEQKTKLVFPMRGKFIVVAGHDFNEAHSFGRSQHFAYDIFGIGPHWEITRNGGATMADFCTWGREIIAPADGVVVYARNDVPDQARPGTVDSSLHDQLPNPGLRRRGKQRATQPWE
jgi:hypothetical protein